jgi:hypothetical protein
MKEFKFELGERVINRLTKIKGVIVARTDYLTGCNKYGVQPEKLTKEGTESDWYWYDEDLLKISGKKFILKVESAGGPSPTAPKN